MLVTASTLLSGAGMASALAPSRSNGIDEIVVAFVMALLSSAELAPRA